MLGLGLRSKIEPKASCCDADEGRAGCLCSAGGRMAAQGVAVAVDQYGHADGGALVPAGGSETAAGGVSAEDRARLFHKYELPPFVPGNILQPVQAYSAMKTADLLNACSKDTTGDDKVRFDDLSLRFFRQQVGAEEARAACLPRITQRSLPPLQCFPPDQRAHRCPLAAAPTD
jgi:hypothetical protein